MARPTGDKTRITPANSAADLMAALYTHFNGTSTKYAANTGTPNGAPAGSDGFSIDPVDVGEVWSFNFRRISTTQIDILVDPDGAITDPGEPGTPPTASANASFERLGVSGLGVSGNNTLIYEFADAFFVMVEDSTSSWWPTGIHGGRIFEPAADAWAAAGCDGLGYLGGSPTMFNFALAWLRASTVGGNSSTIRLANTGTQATDWTAVNTVIPDPNALVVADERIGSGGVFTPVPIGLKLSSTNRILGNLKYLQMLWSARSAMARMNNPDSLEDVYMHIYHAVGTSLLVTPWPDATVPNT